MNSEQLKNRLESTKKTQITVTAMAMALIIMLNIVCLIIYTIQNLQLDKGNVFEIVAICVALALTTKFILEIYKSIHYYTIRLSRFIINTLYSLMGL